MTDVHARIREREHGTRGRYTQGCRCTECRKANCTYERVRSKMITCGIHVPNPFVPATAARRRLKRLIAAGMGRRRIGQLARIPRNTIRDIVDGKRKNLRYQAELRILELVPTLDNRSGNAFVSSAPYLRMLEQLVHEGFTRYRLAAELGSKCQKPSLQIKSRALITVRNARKVRALWCKYMTVSGDATTGSRRALRSRSSRERGSHEVDRRDHAHERRC